MATHVFDLLQPVIERPNLARRGDGRMTVSAGRGVALMGNFSRTGRVLGETQGEKMIRISMVALTAVASLALLAAAHAAGFDCSKFSRNDDGSWRVLAPLQIKGPRGRIDFTPDETYKEGTEKMGLDMAKLLNANCAKK